MTDKTPPPVATEGGSTPRLASDESDQDSTPGACPCLGYECRHIPVPSRWRRWDGGTVDIYRDTEGALQIDMTAG